MLIPYFKFVPMATVAAILGVLSCRMVDTHQLYILMKHDWLAFFISVLTAVLCVVEDTMTGLVIGSLLSMFVYIHAFSIGYVEICLYNRGAVTVQEKLTQYSGGVSAFLSAFKAASEKSKHESMTLVTREREGGREREREGERVCVSHRGWGCDIVRCGFCGDRCLTALPSASPSL